MTEPDLGRIAYEKHIEFCHFVHPRLGMRTATWDELREENREEWRQIARAVVAANRPKSPPQSP